jgi:RNA polymerase sigma-70 factor, ECF subfamily
MTVDCSLAVPIAADHGLPRSAGASSPARRLDPDHLGDHLDRLYRAAWALCGSREDAEDLVQETYARVLQKPRILRSGEDLGYLMRVLRNTYFSRLRAAARRPRADPFPDELDRLEDPSANAPEAALDASELYARIAELPDPFREALVAVDVVGLSYREAARALRVREATITTRLYRARQRLAHALGNDRPALALGHESPASG